MQNEEVTSFENLYRKEWASYIESGNDRSLKWYHLERLHILAQLSFLKHIVIHRVMLSEAWKERNIHEILGQLIRLFLVLPGHIFQMLPFGNIGTSRVSAFAHMHIPEDFEHLFHKNYPNVTQ